eukprot:SAG31_NODE_631_length_13367_cov_6.190648_8_plen_66_part_00
MFFKNVRLLARGDARVPNRNASQVQLYQDMSLRVVTSTGAASFQLFSVLFKFSISLIFLVLVKFN